MSNVAQSVGADLVPVVLFETIERCKKARNGRPPTSVLVNKIAPLASFRLRDKNVVVPVPYSWYRFGTEVEDVPREVTYTSGPGGKATLVDWEGDAPELYPGDRSAEAIREEIDALVSRYATADGDHELAVDEIYNYAPFPFQREYRLVRISLSQTGRGSVEQDAALKTDPWALLSEALDSFPHDQFPAAGRYADPVREVVRLAWNSLPLRDKDLTVEVVEEFWSLFCSYLRVHDSGHSPNVLPTTVQHWRALSERDRTRFERILGDSVVSLSKWVPGLADDATLGPILARREHEQEEESLAIDEALEDAAELRQILADMRKIPAER